MSTGLLVTPSGTALGNPPPNPSDGQIQGAQAKKNALADRVGRLSAQIAAKQAQVQRLDAQAELAEQKLADAIDKLNRAKQAADQARTDVEAAQAAVDAATVKFRSFVRESYMSSPISSSAGNLLTAPDPTSMLQRGDFLQYSAAHKLDIIGQLNRATIAKSNADAAARGAVQRQTEAENAAAQAKQQADEALQTAQQEKQRLNAELAARERELDAARTELATLNNQRAQYLAWKKEQARLAALRAAAEARARAAAAAAAARAAARAAAANGSGGGFDPGPVPAAPATGGRWTPAAGQAAVNRAMQFLGIRYAFAAGNTGGPTYGVCVSGDAWNDCRVFGFDCSGLSLYAWAPYLQLDHYAATQYGQAGSYHPDTAHLMPGDLVFWSSDGTVAGIHHVAIYIGAGNVIQAPHSGDIVRITPLGAVDWGYFGATRPLT